MKNKISFLILAHNEVGTIESEINNILTIKSKLKFDLVVIQDGSRDGTFEKLENLKKKKKFILYNKRNRLGYYNAFLKGVSLSKGNVIFFSDTGGKYNYKKFVNFYEHFKKNNADMVAGYRINREDKLLRQILTLFYGFFINILFQINFKDYDCGFKVFDKKKLLKILKENNFDKNLITSQIFVYFKIYNYKILQLPIKYNEKKNRVSRGIPNRKILNIIFSSVKKMLHIRLKQMSF